MLVAEKILITGATGKIAFPIARALVAAGNEVWGAARLKDATARGKLVEAGIKPVALDVGAGEFSGTTRSMRTTTWNSASAPWKWPRRRRSW